MYFSHWKPPGVSERMWIVNFDASISGEYQTLRGHSCRPSESLGAPTTSLGAPRITVEQSGKNNVFFGNAAGAPGNHSYYQSFNDFQNSCIQFVLSSMYLCIYMATHLHTYIWTGCRRCLRAIRGAPENHDRVSSEIYSKAVIERLWRCTWRR